MLSTRRRRVMAEIEREVHAVTRQLQIDALLDRRPSQLSGGQRQRVALGRAMVRQPAAFLMDEPLSNLDAKLRVHMRSELAELHARLGTTFIYVTHDQVEAMTMSDRVAMMDNGTILQLGRPSDLYARPANIKVAQFIGTPAINLLPAKIGAFGCVELFGAELPIRVRRPAGSALTLGIRPEAITPAPVGTSRPGQHVSRGDCAAARTSAPSTSCTSISRVRRAARSPARWPAIRRRSRTIRVASRCSSRRPPAMCSTRRALASPTPKRLRAGVASPWRARYDDDADARNAPPAARAS